MADADLAEIAERRGGSACLSCLPERGEQDADEQRDDCDNNEQLDQREAAC